MAFSNVSRIRNPIILYFSACAVLMFYDTFFQSRVLLDFFDKLMSVLSPVIYGLVFAYLLAPIVDFFDRYIQKGLPKVKSSLVRGLSILVTWICVIALIYLMFSILIPELVDSTKTLADNFESYYKTVYNWVNSLVENQTIFSDDIYSDQLLSALNGYYDKLVKWVTDTVIPQAQAYATDLYDWDKKAAYTVRIYEALMKRAPLGGFTDYL
jgi:predicted PurR-regulated permease PerM